MSRLHLTLVLVAALGAASCGTRRQFASPEVQWAIRRSTLSTEFAKVRTPTGSLCVQRTEFPQWMTSGLSDWCKVNGCFPSGWLYVRDPSVYLPQQYELGLERRSSRWEPPEEATIGPFLPMNHLNFPDALILANAASAWAGLAMAYEVQGGREAATDGHFTSIRFRRTGERGFRLPTLDEWRAFAPSDWHERSAEFQCSHGNLRDEGRACFDGYRFLAPVASFVPTRNGLYDLWGNAGEWAEPVQATFEEDGWWVEEVHDPNVLRVPGVGFRYVDGATTSPANEVDGYGAGTVPPLPFHQDGTYGSGVRLVIEPDARGRCPSLDVPWTPE